MEGTLDGELEGLEVDGLNEGKEVDGTVEGICDGIDVVGMPEG